MVKYYCDKCKKEVPYVIRRTRGWEKWGLCRKCTHLLDCMINYTGKVFFKTPVISVGEISLDEIKKDFIEELEKINNEA